MSDEEPTDRASDDSTDAPTDGQVDRWELWTKVALGLAVMMACAWVVVLQRPGLLGVQVHAMVIPTLGALTLPVLAWGLFRTLFRPPVIRTGRTVGFFVLLATGYVGNVPIFAPPLATADWTSTNRYLLPFEGEWMVLAGGDEKDHNYHATTAAIRWAYDFATTRNGKRHALDGEELEDWYCVGEPVYAPTSGKVVRATHDFFDNDPGEISGESVFGNHVVIEAGEDEYVFIAHMQRNSVTVRAGDEVTTATEIGKCGNSGRTVEPHIHVHAQDSLDFPIAQGLPLRFSDYQVNGERVEKGMPVGASDWDALDGQMVKNLSER